MCIKSDSSFADLDKIKNNLNSETKENMRIFFRCSILKLAAAY